METWALVVALLEQTQIFVPYCVTNTLQRLFFFLKYFLSFTGKETEA